MLAANPDDLCVMSGVTWKKERTDSHRCHRQKPKGNKMVQGGKVFGTRG